MDTKDLVTVERITHNGGIIVTGLLRDGYGAFFHSETFYGYSESEAIELFVDRYAKKLVTE